MQKIFHALFFAIVFFNSSVHGMEIPPFCPKKYKTSEQEVAAWPLMSFHDKILYRINIGAQNHQGMFGVNLLFSACQMGHLEGVKLLLDAKAKVDLETFAGCIPLQVASDKGYIEIVKLLLAAGANVHWKNCRGETSLRLAQKGGHIEIAQLLQEQMQRDVWEWKKEKLAKRRTC